MTTTEQISPPELIGEQTQVPLWDGTFTRYVNLDTAASTPPLRRVQEALERFLPWYSSVHRGAGYKSRLSTHLYDYAREVVMRFVQANPTTQMAIFVRNTTEALNLLAHRLELKEDEMVITTRMEHHSNLLPWHRHPHEVIAVTSEGRLDLDHLSQILQKHNGKVKLVSVTAASNVSGLITSVRQIARLIHSHGALLAVDAAQLAPHRAITMNTDDPAEQIDILAFSGHKLYAPYGAGALIVPRDLFTSHKPMLVGGGTVCLVTEQGINWANGPELEEAGSPNVIGVVTMAAALEALMSFGMENVAAHERMLTRHAVKRLKRIPSLVLYGPSWQTMLNGTEDRLGVLAFNMKDQHYTSIANILAHEWGVGVRSGCFCAHLYVARLLGISEEDAAEAYERLDAQLPVDLPGMVRASFGIGTTIEDIDRLADGLEAIARGEIKGSYIHNEYGEYELADNDPSLFSHAQSFFA